MDSVRTYSPLELVVAFAFAAVVEIGFFVLLAAAENTARITPEEEDAIKEVPISVQPILDDVPLLKLGGKKVKAKLPDMWVKKPPVKRYRDETAASTKAEKEIDELPETPLAKPDAALPPPDAKLAKEVDEMPDTDASPKELNLSEEGAEDGVKEGTETDPLKAFAVSQYRIKIANWFNSRFKRPEIPCEELKKLSAMASASVGPSRSVTGYTVISASGNADFDGRVQSTLAGIQGSGAQLPPPPPNYPDILETTITVNFRVYSCD